MRKKTRIISMAAAALLAVAPVATGVIPAAGSAVVKADINSNVSVEVKPSNTNSSNTQTSKPADGPYFSFGGYVFGKPDANAPSKNVARTTISIKVGDTVSDVVNQIQKLSIVYHKNNVDSGTVLDKVNTSVLKQRLQSSGVVFDTAKNKTDVIKSLPNSEFNLSLTSNGAEIQIPIVFSASTTTPDTTSNPVIKYTLNGTTTTLTNDSVFQVAKGANFTPTDFYNTNGEEVKINAQQTDKNATPAILSVTSNDVNTSEEGRYYHVTLTATGLTQKTTSVTYTVLIASSAKQPIYGNGPISTYNIYGINVFPGSTTFKTGDEVYVADGTKTINNVSYSQVSTKSKADAAKSNIWVKTSDLTKPATPAGDTNVATHAVMVDSRAYDKNGNYLGHMYYAYNDIQYVPEVVTINGKTYYKVANKNEYVRVTNITGNRRTLRHNAYIYWSSYRRTPGTGKMYRGQTVTTYGPQMRFKNGKKYYRIEGCRNNNKRYIKAVNFY